MFCDKSELDRQKMTYLRGLSIFDKLIHFQTQFAPQKSILRQNTVYGRSVHCSKGPLTSNSLFCGKAISIFHNHSQDEKKMYFHIVFVSSQEFVHLWRSTTWKQRWAFTTNKPSKDLSKDDQTLFHRLSLSSSNPHCRRHLFFPPVFQLPSFSAVNFSFQPRVESFVSLRLHKSEILRYSVRLLPMNLPANLVILVR